MNSDKNIPRFLGAAFFFVFIVSAVSDIMITSVAGADSASEILTNISNNLAQVQISNLLALITSLGIVVLAALLYMVFNEQYKVISLVALGWWMAEAIMLAVSKIGAYALMPLSQEFIEAGSPQSSFFQSLGNFLYHGIDRMGNDIHILFFCLGGILWYYLFFRSRYIPRLLAGYGLVTICLLTINVFLALYDRNIGRIVFLAAPYFIFEPIIGIWLMVKGIPEQPST